MKLFPDMARHPSAVAKALTELAARPRSRLSRAAARDYWAAATIGALCEAAPEEKAAIDQVAAALEAEMDSAAERWLARLKAGGMLATPRAYFRILVAVWFVHGSLRATAARAVLAGPGSLRPPRDDDREFLRRIDELAALYRLGEMDTKGDRR